MPTSLDTAARRRACCGTTAATSSTSASSRSTTRTTRTPSSTVVTFTTTGKSNVYPQVPTRTLTGAAKANYLGGPFVILASDAPTFRKLLDNTITARDASNNIIDFSQYRTRNATQTAAPTTSCSIGIDHYVNIHRSTTAFVANIGKAFQAVPPRLALLATNKNAHTSTISNNILQAYLTNAGLDVHRCERLPAGLGRGGNACGLPERRGVRSDLRLVRLRRPRQRPAHGDRPAATRSTRCCGRRTGRSRTSTGCPAPRPAAARAPARANCTCVYEGRSDRRSTCSVTAGTTLPGPPNANELTALSKISTFLDGADRPRRRVRLGHELRRRLHRRRRR